MTSTTEFFADYAMEQYSEFVDAELREIFQCSDAHDEKFEFDDIPF